jgi:hypothetical protein
MKFRIQKIRTDEWLLELATLPLKATRLSSQRLHRGIAGHRSSRGSSIRVET